MIGLIVLLAVVIVAVLAGPASASEKRVYFKATSALEPVLKDPSGNPYDPGNWVFTKQWTGPNGMSFMKGWLWHGQAYLPPSGTGTIPNVTGYCRNYLDIVEQDDSSGSLIWGMIFMRSTVYVGCQSLADVTRHTSIWKGTAVATMTPDGVDHYTGVSHGIAGAVKGWEMHWTATVDFFKGISEVSGYYVKR
jgi:hypothetical protein